MLPVETLENDRERCVKDYPVDERIYSSLSPGKELNALVGNLTEREAVSKVIGQEKVKAIVQFPIEEGYKLSYDVEEPTIKNPHWSVHLYKNSTNKDILTIKKWEIDAFSGEIKEK